MARRLNQLNFVVNQTTRVEASWRGDLAWRHEQSERGRRDAPHDVKTHQTGAR